MRARCSCGRTGCRATTSSSVSSVVPSSTVITPSLPTFFMASAMMRPISVSPLAEMVPICAISTFEVTFLAFFLSSATTASTARSMPRFRSMGFMPAATALTPFLSDRAGEHDRRGRAVAGLIGGFGRDLPHHLHAHVLELVVELDLPGDGYAVLGDLGAERPVDRDVAPLGPERDAHRTRERVDAAQHSLARLERELDLLGGHRAPP